MGNDDVRARFEAWAQREQYALSRLPTGAYADYDTQNAWFGYRAAHADLSGEVRELVEAIEQDACERAIQAEMGVSEWPSFIPKHTADALAKFTHQEKPVAYCPKCAANQPHHTDPNSSGCLHLCDVCNSVVEY